MRANPIGHGIVIRKRRGAALIDVLVSLVLLAVGGTGLVTLLGQTAHTLRHLRDQERVIHAAAGELDRLVLWDRAAFVAHSGRTSLRGWTLVVQQTSRELFDVSIAETDTTAVLLRTLVYRPDSADASSP